MKHITVLSHHRSGGGQPLDSFWFSSEECKRHGVQLDFLWTRSRKSFLGFITSRKVVFDGAFTLAISRGARFYALSQILGMQTAVYWHETEWSLEKAIRLQSQKYQVIQQVLNNPKVVHFHVCNSGLKMLHERYGVDSRNLYLLPNIAEPSRLLQYQLPMPCEGGLFVACGVVMKRKGVDLFLDIAEKVISQGVKAKFVWIGPYKAEETSQDAIAKELSRRGLEEKVFFTGKMQNPAEIIKKATLFLLTSRDDPMPKVLMEALALGKRCIAFGVGGVPELLGEYGTIIPPGDTEAFAKAIIQKSLEQDDETKQHLRRQWYLQRYSPAAFGVRFAEAVEWWDHKWGGI